MENIVVKRGEIFYADLSLAFGSEQKGIRPVIIIQNDIGNEYSPTTIVTVITSQINEARLPTHVAISCSEYGLKKDSVVLLEQVRTIDKRRLKDKIGCINENDMRKIDKAWLISSGFDMERLNSLVQNMDIKFNSKKEEVGQYYNYKLGKLVEYLEEDIEHEFKEIRGNNPVDAIKSNVGEYIASFFNGFGGTIYYGISDERIVKGMEIDNKQKDYIKRNIYNAVASITPNIAPDSIDIEFKNIFDDKNEKLKDMYVLEVHVNGRLDEKSIYLYKNELHLRCDGVKKKLNGDELIDYIKRKTIKDYIK